MSASGANPRYVDVFELARTQAQVSGSLPIGALPRLSASVAQPTGAIEYTMRGFIDHRGRPAAHLTFAGVVQLACDRCSESVPVRLTGDADYYFVRSEQELGRIPVDDSPDEPLLGAARFDLRELIEDEAILGLPMSPRHDACERVPSGPRSSAHVASGAADKPHPFAALASLRSRRK